MPLGHGNLSLLEAGASGHLFRLLAEAFLVAAIIAVAVVLAVVIIVAAVAVAVTGLLKAVIEALPERARRSRPVDFRVSCCVLERARVQRLL
jgi:hypothetical protein